MYMTASQPPARYFPVRARPYRMSPGLLPFGSDFGNDERDALFFQRDREADRYRACKENAPAGRSRITAVTDAEQLAHRAVLTWMMETLRREHPGLLADDGISYHSVALAVQEDFAVLHRPPGESDRAIAVFVACPSGWRPETIAGASFRHIHGPVPGFGDVDAANTSMLASMIERGPYVRFVWTVCADDNLDHHPEQGRREPWSEHGRGWLRVERQVTVPFPHVGASLFLIRTYLYPFEDLDAAETRTLASALELMPPDVATYKGLSAEVRAIARHLLVG